VNLRRAAAAVGVVGAVGGLAIGVAGSAGPLALDEALATVAGLLAVVQGVRYGFERRRRSYEATDVDDPEARYAAPVPGADFDAAVATGAGSSIRAASSREEVRERLRAAAVEAVVAAEGVDEATATDRVAAGTWTDDRVAAALLAGERPPLRARVAALVARESRFERAARRTVTAVATLEEGRG
jgi:hypothetical protein